MKNYAFTDFTHHPLPISKHDALRALLP
jgi:hypothetical protein